MSLSRIRQAEKPYLRDDLPPLAIGDSVHVAVKVTEGERERTQVFSGTVIKIRGAGLGRTFTVRRIVQGEGVERIFPFHSPVIVSVEVVRKGRVRRAKLYYLRDRVGKGTRLREVVGHTKRRRRGVEIPEEAADAGDEAGEPTEQTAAAE
jgi:large subunit ribosomal protein L19